eukprot:CAMPEP_0202692910 /NCGR_PEP_ID=MMETSP1385-20130828/7172_1 /ASSEMBLY_ACC=CAM_ASM_000861 /TAXON_ID=933848 /ORGANISM="Elphidium margaritaceum" /LENGTH=131 /DNA_ID=CAMNT_0049348517 /DNA_START=90 /DNA_END=485 /DNA_ORIENTATION=-
MTLSQDAVPNVNEPIVAGPKYETHVHAEPDADPSTWQMLQPWRGMFVLSLFWLAIVAIVICFTCRCYSRNGRSLKEILLKRTRGKYSNYNFVSIYSETEAELGGPFAGATEDEYDSDNNPKQQFDEISIIK